MLAAYDWVLGGAADLGLGRRAGETMWEYRSRLRGRVPVGDELDRLTGLAGRATYSLRDVADEQGHEAVASARSLLRDLRRAAGPLRTVAGAFRPV